MNFFWLLLILHFSKAANYKTPQYPYSINRHIIKSKFSKNINANWEMTVDDEPEKYPKFNKIANYEKRNDDNGDEKIFGKLLSKLDNVLEKTERLGRGLEDVNGRLYNLSRRQEDQENRLENLFKEMRTDLKKSHDNQNMTSFLQTALTDIKRRSTEFKLRQKNEEHRLENLVKEMRMDLKKSHDIQNITSYIQTALTDINRRRTESKLSQPWTYVIRRLDGSFHFNRNWHDYKIGFGSPDGSFFMGLERLHALTANGSAQELLIVLSDFKNQRRYAHYDVFRIGSETEKYAIKELGTYSGDAGDGLRYHLGKSFSTFDRNNNVVKAKNCARLHQGGWWYHGTECFKSNLNGIYRSEKSWRNAGVSWAPWLGSNHSLKYAAMMIRPKM